jgi:hypothetical protein
MTVTAVPEEATCDLGTLPGRRRMTVQKRCVTISTVRYRELLDAKQQRDAVVNARGIAWWEIHEWLSLASRCSLRHAL